MKFWFSSKSTAPDLFEVTLGVECAWPSAVFAGDRRDAEDQPAQAPASVPRPAPTATPTRQP